MPLPLPPVNRPGPGNSVGPKPPPHGEGRSGGELPVRQFTPLRNSRMRILYIHATLVPPPLDPKADSFHFLPEALEGDILHPLWFSSPEEVEGYFGAGSYPVYARGRFRYHWFLAMKNGRVRSKLAWIWFNLRKGMQLHRERPFDCVVTWAHTATAMCGLALKAMTAAKLIVEVVIQPETAYLTETERLTWRDRAMHVYSDICLHLSLLCGDRAHLLYPTQIASYPLLQRVRTSTFHLFVPVSLISPKSQDGDPYVLLVGAPWHRKGVDVLVKAFRRLAGDFPNVSLKLLGFFPEPECHEAVKADYPRIELLKSRPNPETLEIMSRAAVFALPSRCEGMPRVVLEAMAAGVPVVASDVSGIPVVVRDGENGYLVPVGDDVVLEDRLRKLLSDDELRRKMGAKGYEIAHTELNESRYAELFQRMIDETVNGDR